MDTRGYELSDLVVSEFFCKSDQLEDDAIFRRSIYTFFSPCGLKRLRGGRVVEDSIQVDNKGDKENSPPNNSYVSATHLASQIADKLSFWNLKKKRKFRNTFSENYPNKRYYGL